MARVVWGLLLALVSLVVAQPSPSSVPIFNFSSPSNPYTPPKQAAGTCEFTLYDPATGNSLAYLCEELAFDICNNTYEILTGYYASAGKIDSIFVSDKLCQPLSDRGACSDNQASCWMSNSAGCLLVIPFVSIPLQYHPNKTCEESTVGAYVGYIDVEADICTRLVPVVGQYGNCNSTAQTFTLNSGYNATEIYLHILSVAYGQTLIVKSPLTTDAAVIYGILIADTNASIIVAGNTSVASNGGLVIDGGYSSGSIVAGPNSSMAVNVGGNMTSNSLILRGGTLSVNYNGSVNTGSLVITNGTDLIIQITDENLRDSTFVQYLFSINTGSVMGSFQRIKIDMSGCSECSRRCLNASSATTTTLTSRLQVAFSLEGSCPSDLKADPNEPLSPIAISAIVIVSLGVVAGVIGCSVYFVRRKRKVKVEFDSIKTIGRVHPSSSHYIRSDDDSKEILS